MRSHQRQQVFFSLPAENRDDEPFFLKLEMSLIKNGGIMWNSTYAMLLHAFKLRKAIELYQLRHKPSKHERDIPYSGIEDRITPPD